MKVISIITEKGGVGKTTTAIHLGAALANRSTKVLLIDFDSQTNLSQGYKIDTDDSYNIVNFLEGTGSFRLKEKSKNLYVLPGSKKLESVESLQKNSLKTSLEIFKNHFDFDYCLVDCPPRPLLEEKLTLGEIALRASDYMLSPIEPEEYSINGINSLIPELLRIKSENSKLELLGFFFNKIVTTSRRFKSYSEILRNSDAAPYLLKSYVRRDERVEDAKALGKTIFQLDDKSRASKDLKNLVSEIKKKMNKS